MHIEQPHEAWLAQLAEANRRLAAFVLSDLFPTSPGQASADAKQVLVWTDGGYIAVGEIVEMLCRRVNSMIFEQYQFWFYEEIEQFLRRADLRDLYKRAVIVAAGFDGVDPRELEDASEEAVREALVAIHGEEHFA